MRLAPWRLFESLSIRVITKCLEDSPNMQLDRLFINLSQIILREFAHGTSLFLSHFLILHLVIRFLFLYTPRFCGSQMILCS